MLAELLELAPQGVEERDPGGGTVEYALYGAPGELPTLPDLKAAAGDALVDVFTEEVAADWAERWRQFHRPVVIEDRLTVRPPWEPPGHTEIDLVIDPGRAFGTGAHPTTRLCLELLLELDRREGPFVDLGCGSGVLAIAAARLGFAPVAALDVEVAAVEATRENANRNGVALDVSGAPHNLGANEAFTTPYYLTPCPTGNATCTTTSQDTCLTVVHVHNLTAAIDNGVASGQCQSGQWLRVARRRRMRSCSALG